MHWWPYLEFAETTLDYEFAKRDAKISCNPTTYGMWSLVRADQQGPRSVTFLNVIKYFVKK